MYLKSLVLKGFKSFADRSVLSLEPGITAVVGPNGSGKSNISDAVLWVLGERNAKNLRGQAMEDVIFAGSSARKSVSVAEVDLVLDNSDGTLPVEFNEVALTRRMYRSGESEYLINGSPARRMDFIDILHDTGLGTGTHSIISQGNLDAVLASKPEDRRTLIEEAAGVLKHKQRKERSARKLQAMDAHLERVRDITSEIERQLKPLARKAQRAQAYQGISEQLSDLELMLAIDDLRTLQGKWDETLRREKEAAAAIDIQKLNVKEAEEKLEKLQVILQEKGLYVGDLTAQRGRFHMVVERFESADMLLAEKAKSIRTRLSQAEDTMLGSSRRITRLEEDADSLRDELDEQTALRNELETQTEETGRKLEEASCIRKKIDADLLQLQTSMRTRERQITDLQNKLARLRDSQSGQLTHKRLLETRIEELEAETMQLQKDFDERCAGLDEQMAALEELSAAMESATKDVDAAQADLRAAELALSVARDEKQSIAAKMHAIEEINRQMRATNEAAAWMADHAETYDKAVKPLSSLIKAPEHLESLVEQLLGADLASLFASDRDSAQVIMGALSQHELAGAVSLLYASTSKAADGGDRSFDHAVRLIDRLEYPQAAERAIEGLLGDVYVADDADTAFRLAGANEQAACSLRFATPDGLVVSTNAKASMVFSSDEETDGTLARERQLNALTIELENAVSAIADAEEKRDSCACALDRKRALSIELSQTHARKQGAHTSAEAERQRLATKLGACRANLESAHRDLEKTLRILDEAHPEIEEAEEALADLQDQNADHDSRLAELEQQRQHAFENEQSLSDTVNQGRLSLATSIERVRSLDRQLRDREADIVRAHKSKKRAEQDFAVLSVAAKRIDPLHELLQSCRESAQIWVEELAGRAALEQSNSAELNESINEARGASKAAHEAQEQAVASLNEIRVEKGRLEVQVDGAIQTIVDTCGMPLETALQTEPPENRAEAEAEAEKLRRKLSNMGTIDSNAAEEYELVNARYDFMVSQIEDVEAARRALKRIVAAIDERMKSQFEITFEKVNANFQEIFSTLFPGGTASLEIINGDDPSALGVEVNAQPRGKRITKMMLMSGGEKSLTAIALLFAVYRIRHTPFFILDEVEAALDDSNLRRLTGYLQTLRTQTQLIMITHQRRTMEMADVLYGVSMQADGVTKVVSQKLDKAASAK